MGVTQQELDSFHRFVSERMRDSSPNLSFEEWLTRWRSQREYDETVADVRQGLQDYADGKAEPLAKTFAEIRKNVGLSR